MYVMLEAPLLCMDLSNGNDHWLKMSRSKPGFALAYRTGVNKGAGFWFAVFLSLLSILRMKYLTSAVSNLLMELGVPRCALQPVQNHIACSHYLLPSDDLAGFEYLSLNS